jgi:hypothetical protein
MMAAGAALVWALFFAIDFEEVCSLTEKNTTVRRDYAASVTSYGSGRDKLLLEHLHKSYSVAGV